MIVAIASDDGVHVARDPGRCGGFVVFEIEGSTAVRVGYRSNACAESCNGHLRGQDPSAGLATSYESLLAELSDCSALIFKAFDEGVVRALQDSALAAYVCPGSSVDQAADLFARGRLTSVPSAAKDQEH